MARYSYVLCKKARGKDMKDLTVLEFIAHLINLKKSRRSNVDLHWISIPEPIKQELLIDAQRTLEIWKKGEAEALMNQEKLKGQSDRLN